MNRITRVAAFALVGLIGFALPLTAQASVAGSWVLTVEGPEGPADIMAKFTQDGSAVEGTLEMPMVMGAEMSDGVIEGSTFSFLVHVDFDGQWFTIEAEAEVEGDEMDGSFYVAEFGSMTFRGTRSDS